jgi:hypothetical protein
MLFDDNELVIRITRLALRLVVASSRDYFTTMMCSLVCRVDEDVVGPSLQALPSRFLAKQHDVKHVVVVGGPVREHIGLQRGCGGVRCGCGRVVDVGNAEKVRVFKHAVRDAQAEGLDLLSDVDEKGGGFPPSHEHNAPHRMAGQNKGHRSAGPDGVGPDVQSTVAQGCEPKVGDGSTEVLQQGIILMVSVLPDELV